MQFTCVPMALGIRRSMWRLALWFIGSHSSWHMENRPEAIDRLAMRSRKENHKQTTIWLWHWHTNSTPEIASVSRNYSVYDQGKAQLIYMGFVWV